ncbi:MAG TPA: hypothetical protein DCZ07_06095, partial [Alphaproteobacteria bacterium]|nr:hypothetical protein [Alphaproteobacteria bacterium]
MFLTLLQVARPVILKAPTLAMIVAIAQSGIAPFADLSPHDTPFGTSLSPLFYVRASQELHELPLFIDDTGALPIAALSARARRLKRQ